MLSDPEHVLYVEDSDEDAALVAHLLRGSPFRLARVRTYGEMMSYGGNPDVVLLDLRIPGSNNPIRLVADAVRRFRGAGVILLTGIADREGEEISVRAMAEGAQIRLVKATFDKRRLQLSIREAYQQRQHMIRVLRESRDDMRIDPDMLQQSVRSVLDPDLYQRLDSIEQIFRRKFKQLGIEDTQPIQLPLSPPDIDPKKRAEIARAFLGWFTRHDKLLHWIVLAAFGAYLTASDFVLGIRNAVFETRDAVQRIEKRLDETP